MSPDLAFCVSPEPSRQTASTWLTVSGPPTLLGGGFLSGNPRQPLCQVHVGALSRPGQRGAPERRGGHSLALIRWCEAVKQEAFRAHKPSRPQASRRR